MNIIKKLRILLLLPVVFLTVTCTKLKDTCYDCLLADQFTPSQSDVGALLSPAYLQWRELFNKWNSYFWAQEICADELLVPRRPGGWYDGGVYERMHEHNWSVDEAILVSTWQRAYNGISACNRIIEQVQNDVIPLGADKAQAIAELRVLRTTFYYVLCDLFGNVPIITQFTVESGYLPDQNTRKEVFDFITKELKESIPDISDKVDVSTYGRMNKNVAYTLLAKMYLNAKVYTGEEKWNESIAYCDSVINSGKYIIEPNRKTVYATQNEGSKETIWAIVFDHKYMNPYWSDWNAFDHHMQSLPEEFQAMFKFKNNPWSGLSAIPQFINSFDTLNDKRFTEQWYRGGPFYDANGNVIKQSSKSIDPSLQGKPLMLYNFLYAAQSVENEHTMGYRLGKFEYAKEAYSILDNDYPFFRYADILMMKAESLLRTGNADAAAALVNQVRARNFSTGGVLTGSDLMQGSNYDYGRRDVVKKTYEGGADIQYGRFLDELGYEFFEESRRRQDMIRFGAFHTKSWLSHDAHNNINKTLYPIPTSILNTNDKLKQNPGY